MPNSLYNMFNPQPVTPINNMMAMVNQFQQFKNSFQGDPKQAVMNLVSSGQITQEQLTQLQQTAQQLQSLFR